MTATALTLIIATATISVVHATTISARVSYPGPISTTGDSHGPQVLVNTLQPADRPVFTVSPTPNVMSGSQLQSASNPQE